jgi:hypothetical protein
MVAEQFFDADALGYVRTYYPYVCSIRAKWDYPEKYERVIDFYLPKAEPMCTN